MRVEPRTAPPHAHLTPLLPDGAAGRPEPRPARGPVKVGGADQRASAAVCARAATRALRQVCVCSPHPAAGPKRTGAHWPAS